MADTAEGVYREAARVRGTGVGISAPEPLNRYIEAMVQIPYFRAEVEATYRSGYERGADDEYSAESHRRSGNPHGCTKLVCNCPPLKIA